MRIIRARDCRPMPWKNGGGTTTEIAVHPPGASLDSFDWRISMAHVGADGPFSVFSGVDRTLSILSGNGIALAFDDGETAWLRRTSAPYAFAADRRVEGRLIDGPIDDLNVMTRRGRWRHSVGRLSGPGPIAMEPARGLTVLVARSDGWTITTPDTAESLASGDSAVLDSGAHAVLTGNGGEMFAIDLWAEAAA